MIGLKKGTRVTVVGVDDGDIMPYLCSDGEMNLWIAKDSVAPGSEADEKPEFHVGQIYRVGYEPNKETIVIVTSVRGGAVDVKVIRGNSRLRGFNVDSEAARSLTLLTGPQIGEAIRKWDEEHAKKSGVREVKRAAKVGEYIKALCDSDFGRFKKGDILKATSDCHNCDVWRGKAVGYNGTDYVIETGKYVVLEGYKPEQTSESPKAKAWDTIRLTQDCGGTVAVRGNSGKVVNVREDKAFVKLPPHTESYHLPYGIPHGSYEIVSSGKHVYTDSEIAEAKKFVLDTIRDLAEKDETVILSHSSGDENDNGAFACYILGHDTLVDADEDTFRASVVRYNSMCSDNDEPNEWIGKAVALCKALHKPLPNYTL